MSATEGLLKGSFKGEGFFLQSSDRSGGRKNAFHTFPNSDTTLAEDMGRAPLSFTLRMIIAGTIDDGGKLLEAYYVRRNRLIQKLEEGGEGEFIHPFWGLFTVRVDGEYTLTEDISKIGSATITQKFTQVGENKTVNTDGQSNFFPTETSAETVRKDLEDLELIIQISKANDEDEAFVLSNLEAADALRADKEAIADNFVIISQDIEDADDLGEFNADINKFRNNPISQFSENVNSILALFSKASEFIANPERAYNSFQIFWDFNDDITTIATTPQLADKLQNELAYKTIMQTMSTAYSTDSAVNIPYSTDIQLQAIEDAVTDQLLKIADNEVDESTLYDGIQTLKVDSNVVFSNELLKVGRVITIDVVNSSMSNIVYSNYGNLDNYDLIRDLNDFNNLSLINGPVKIVTQS